jgi:hypothetical protein
MKKTFLSFLLLFIIMDVGAQKNLFYKCKNITQRDSIGADLKNKGYVGYECDRFGLYLNLQEDHTFCYTTTLIGYNEITLEELYSDVKGGVYFEEKAEGVNEDLCSDIQINTDKFDGEIRYSSPDVNDIAFIKYKKNKATNQYVSISLYNAYLSGYSNYGLTILFKSGKKIVRSKEKVDVNVSSGSNWRYSVFFTPTANEISLFKKEDIIAVKLYIFDSEINQGNKIKGYANCVLITPKTQVKKKSK